MITKEWMQFFAGLTSAQCREMGELLLGMTGKDKRDAAEEARMQEHIATLPGPSDDGAAEPLESARLAANEANRNSGEQSV